ncbi:TVG0910197 [Thermoplasma volcanium GSS1]|uniref:TVG0910197 protein n=1 Tax=Thermoplasma volcanium (strain ATCC 51530 / DSM 4299 / JCM 9571 / NBRC 15438 / GSS1) TaxID=273116 RepID=Q97AB8_THEVO|nr:TVG0910197 [Thermoplasma volcanium GSS1]
MEGISIIISVKDTLNLNNILNYTDCDLYEIISVSNNNNSNKKHETRKYIYE